MEKVIKSLCDGWKLCFEENRICKNYADDINTIEKIERNGFKTIDASVPGNFELDLLEHGLIDDPLYSTNSFKLHKWEYYHVWYYNTFDLEDINGDEYIKFFGIDTISDIYINGLLVKSTDNMFIEYEVPLSNLKKGKNEIVVHIKPVVIEARKYDTPVSSHAMDCSYESLNIRKAPHMYGWDIMPRIVSCGIWKPVTIFRRFENRIKDAFVYTVDIYEEKNSARLCSYLSLELSEDDLDRYSIELEGTCKDSSFFTKSKVYHTNYNVRFFIEENLKLWWPKNMGDPNLYDMQIRLYLDNELCDTYSLKLGVRLISLENSVVFDDNGNGEFCFYINRKRAFIKGTNWVPLDSFHSQDTKRLPQALMLLDDLNCNMVRCWGGNVYEDNSFFDFCDENGIMVWQDFALACAVYPQEQSFFDKIEEEARFIIKKLRNHASLVVWCGDNECDYFYQNALGMRKDPNKNRISREILPQIVNAHDFTRPFLKSSPYVSQECHDNKMIMVEGHLWGYRTDYTNDYHRNNPCRFISEAGFYGAPSVDSIKKFISPEHLWPPMDADGLPDEEWVAHATLPEPFDKKAPQFFSKFVKTMVDSNNNTFTKQAENLTEFVKQAQVFQAEGFKFLIENCRINKWTKKTGILWWQMLNGWPQFDNGIVDYYFKKKLAYDFIKKSHQDICLMMNSQGDDCNLYYSNDTPFDKSVDYSVVDLTTGSSVASGTAVASADSSGLIVSLSNLCTKQTTYKIIWKIDNKEYCNHFLYRNGLIDLTEYLEALEKSNMYNMDVF